MNRRLFAAVVVLLFWSIEPAAAEPGNRRFETVQLGEGPSREAISSVAQTDQGFIWIATTEGLIRFDGYETKVFHRGSDSHHQLGSNRISDLLVSSTGRLWVATRGGGLSRYNPETEDFFTFRYNANEAASLSQDDILDLTEDSQGRIWVATAHEGLNRLDDPESDSGTFTIIRHEDGEPTSLADNRTRSLFFDQQGNLWVGTMGGVGRLLEENPPRFLNYRHDPKNPNSLEDDEVWSVLVDSDGVLWVGAWGGGLSRLRDPSKRPGEAVFEVFHASQGSENGLSDNRVMELLEDREGTLWIGTQSGLDELTLNERTKENPRFLNHTSNPLWPFSLSQDNIAGLFEDNQGDLWIGTNHGLNRLDRRFEQFTTFRFQKDFPGSLGDYPSQVVADGQKRLWVGHGQGIDRIDLNEDPLQRSEIKHFPIGEPIDGGLPGGVVHLMKDSFGFLWVCSYQGLGLMMPEAENRGPSSVFHFVKEFTSTAILLTFEDRQGTLWVGTYRGLYEVVRDESGFPIQFVPRFHDSKDVGVLNNQHINALAMNSKGVLWIGTYRGLNRFDPATQQITQYLADPTQDGSLKHDFINTLLVDDSDRLWVGTRGGGLSFWNSGGGFTTLGTEHGLPSETLYSLRQGPNDTIWIGTPRGLVEYHPETGRSRVFGRSHGLPTDEIEELSAVDDGWIVVVTDSGVTRFNPSHLNSNGFQPPVEFTELRVLNKRVPIGHDSILSRAIDRVERLVLRHTDYLVSLKFAALTYRQPQGVRYRYRLEGLYDDWIETDSADRKAVFSSLPPGNFLFEVQASLEDGSWTEPGRLKMVVLPPWWLTWWAKALASGLLFLLIISWPLIRLGRERKHNARLEERITARTAKLAEANRRLEASSLTDYLTGLPNRRHFIARAEKEAVTFKRSHRPFSLAIADIDNFKAVNDSWGHEAGDHVLRCVAGLLRDTIRDVDIVARWGGEEFIFLFPETDLEGAMIVAEKVRRSVDQEVFQWQEEEIPVTLTLGLAQVSADGSVDACASRADTVLFLGKRSGKNRVVVNRDHQIDSPTARS